MSFIVTAYGDELSLTHPRAGQFAIATIAHSLSQINRFNGHALRPYSVAEHSLLVCEILEREFTTTIDVHGRLAGLMHDAHEFVATDMHSPGKQQIGPAWDAWEGKWSQLVRIHFALQNAFRMHGKAVKRADLIALATERRDVVHPGSGTPWPGLEGIEPVTWVDLMSPERVNTHWYEWRQLFVDKYEELEFERNNLLFPAGMYPTSPTINL